ncbi:unnamed protein product, partial [Ectocarpus sp. 12 AP-2014]
SFFARVYISFRGTVDAFCLASMTEEEDHDTGSHAETRHGQRTRNAGVFDLLRTAMGQAFQGDSVVSWMDINGDPPRKVAA